MSELNSRHLKLINELIRSYKNGKIKFSSFVNNLGVLIESFDSPPELWLNKAHQYWEELEIINAILLEGDENAGESTEKLKSEIVDIVDKISELMGSFLTKGDALKRFINLEIPLWYLKATFDRFPKDDELIVLITKLDITSVLTHFVEDKIQLLALNEWAEIIECRKDIRYDASYEEQLKEIIFELANPDIFSPLTKERALNWISILNNWT